MAALSANQEFFLQWLLDERREGRGAQFNADHQLLDTSPSKGTQAEFAASIGVLRSTVAAWRREPKFREAYRKAVEDEVRDPTHMLDVIRKVRSMAKGLDGTDSLNGPRPADELKAAELYSRLTGYVAPDKPEPARAAKDMTDEELERAALVKANATITAHRPKTLMEVLS